MSNAWRARILLAFALVLSVALFLHLRAGERHTDAGRAEERGQKAHEKFARHEAPQHEARAEFARLVLAAKDAAEREAAHVAHDLPHPITHAHARLYRDLDLLHAADEAIKNGAYDEARALLAQHHRDLPGISTVEEEGLLLLADCAERPSTSNVARVQSFYDVHSESTVRRRLRRACLELASRD
jgi:hypothetical protein